MEQYKVLFLSAAMLTIGCNIYALDIDANRKTGDRAVAFRSKEFLDDVEKGFKILRDPHNITVFKQYAQTVTGAATTCCGACGTLACAHGTCQVVAGCGITVMGYCLLTGQYPRDIFNRKKYNSDNLITGPAEPQASRICPSQESTSSASLNALPFTTSPAGSSNNSSLLRERKKSFTGN